MLYFLRNATWHVVSEPRCCVGASFSNSTVPVKESWGTYPYWGRIAFVSLGLYRHFFVLRNSSKLCSRKSTEFELMTAVLFPGICYWLCLKPFKVYRWFSSCSSYSAQDPWHSEMTANNWPAILELLSKAKLPEPIQVPKRLRLLDIWKMHSWFKALIVATCSQYTHHFW